MKSVPTKKFKPLTTEERLLDYSKRIVAAEFEQIKENMLRSYDEAKAAKRSVKAEKRSWDYKKAYDMVPHPWILKMLQLTKVAGNISSFLSVGVLILQAHQVGLEQALLCLLSVSGVAVSAFLVRVSVL